MKSRFEPGATSDLVEVTPRTFREKTNTLIVYSEPLLKLQPEVLLPVHQNFTTITVKVVDVNDNRPEFSSSSYVSSILLKDAEEGKLLLTVTATDKDVGNNSFVTYRLAPSQHRHKSMFEK